MPARLAFFVAQLGRKFRLFSLTVQRYNLFIAVYESRANFFLVFLRKRQANLLRVAVLQFSKGFSHTLKILLYLYINIELIFDYHRIYFGTATLQQPQHTAKSQVGVDYRGQNTVKFVQNEKYSAKSGDFLRFYAYLCHVIRKY